MSLLEEKMFNSARELLIEKHGEEFLELPVAEQNNLVYGEILNYLEQMRKSDF